MDKYIQTERTVLRPLAVNDAERFASVYHDSKLSRMTGSIPHPFYPMAAEFWIMKARAAHARGLRYPYALTLKQDGINPDDAPLMGAFGLFSNEHGNWEIGYGLEKSLWGQGYATEAAQALLETADRSFDAPQIAAGHYDDNHASARVLTKLGFVPTGEAPLAYSMARLTKAPCVKYLRPAQSPPTTARAS